MSARKFAFWAAGVVVAVCLAASVSAVATSGASATSSVPDSSTLSGNVVATGTLYTTNGAVVGAGKVMTLYAMPTNQVLDALAEGDSFNLQTISTATTDASGQFVMKIPSAATVAPFEDSDGVVNYQMISSDTSGTYNVAFAQYVSPDPAPTSSPTSTPKPTPRPTTTSGPINNAVGMGGAQTASSTTPVDDAGDLEIPDFSVQPIATTSTSQPTKQTNATEETTPGDKSCRSSVVKKYPHIYAELGSVFVLAKGVSAKLTYTYGAHSSFSVATSLSGSSGSFKLSGTSDVASAATVNFPAAGYGDQISERTWVNYAKYKLSCVSDYNGLPTPDVYLMEATSVAGGNYPTKATPPSINPSYCVTYQAGGGQTISKSKATTYTAGVDLSPVIGLDGSARSGYSSKVTLSYQFTQAHGLCGTTGDPAGGHASRLIAIP